MRTRNLIRSAIFGLMLGVVSAAVPAGAASRLIALAIVSPTTNTTVSGQVVVTAQADADGLMSVQFFLDGQPYGAAIGAGACRAVIDTTTIANGTHTVGVTGLGSAGETVIAAPVTLTVNNTTAPPPPPQGSVVVTSPSAGAITSPVTLSATFPAGATLVEFRFLTSSNTIAFEKSKVVSAGATTDTIANVALPSTLTGTFNLVAVTNLGTSAPVSVSIGVAPPPPPQPPASTNTIDTVAAQLAAHDARLQAFQSAVNVSFSTLLTAASTPKDLTPTALQQIAATVRSELTAALTPPQLPTTACVVTSASNNTSGYCRYDRKVIPAAVGTTLQLVIR